MSTNIQSVNRSFIKHINSLSETLPVTMTLIQKGHELAKKKFEEFEKDHIDYDDSDGDEKMYIEADYFNKFKKIDKSLDNTGIAKKIVPRSFIVSLVSQYDAFLGSLVEELFNAKPKVLSDSERQLSFSQLSEFSSIEDAREYIIDKEIDNLLRKSHSEQFDWLSNKFNIKIEPSDQLWADFIELTERRNLFVHSDGYITSQYLNVCKNNGVEINSDFDVGTQLWVPQDYFENAYSIIFEMGIKLSQVLWRKIIPNEISSADEQLIDISLELLEEKKYKLAYEICHFATKTLKNIDNEEYRRIIAINKCIALKWGGKEDKSQEILNSFDWSGWKDELLLAVAVLKDNYEKSYNLMRSIGTNSNLIGYNQYRYWPLFKEIRKEEKFKETYEEIFDHSFSEITNGESKQNKNGSPEQE